MTFSAIAVLVRHNFEYLDFRVDILYNDPFTGNAPVFGSLFLREFAAFRLLFWCFAVLMNCRDSLIATVHLLFDAIENAPADGVFVQLKIVCLSRFFRDTNDFFRVFVDDDLNFYRVPFLFS